MNLTRRHLLLAGTGTGVTLLTGCVAGTPENNEDNSGGAVPDYDDDDERDDSTDELTGPMENYTVVPVTREHAGDWWRDTDDGPGITVELTNTDEVRSLVNTDNDVERFIDETDFAKDAVYYLEGAGPNACYARLDVEELIVIANGGYTLQANVKVRDVSDDDEDCAQLITFPSVLLRVESEVMINDATFRMVDGWGNEEPVTPIDLGEFAKE